MNNFETIFLLLDFEAAFSALAGISVLLIFLLIAFFCQFYFENKLTEKIKSFFIWSFSICIITFIASLFAINLLPSKEDIIQYNKLINTNNNNVKSE